MEILFLTLENFSSYNDHDMYADVMRELISAGHRVHTVLPAYGSGRTALYTEGESTFLRVNTDSTTGSKNLIKKGLSTLLIGGVFKQAIRKYHAGRRFDLVVYSTPPITFAGPIRYIQRKHGASTYLMLKDIFPQNAVDLGMLSKTGIKGLVWLYFRCLEKQLYAMSDHIGCMSPANVSYLLRHNPSVEPSRVGLCPNSLRLPERTLTDKQAIRDSFGIPKDKTVFLYGGNLGKPQGADHIIACLKAAQRETQAFFLVVGGGTEYDRLSREFSDSSNVRIMPSLPVEQYHVLASACDVGLIFLDRRFTIPNFPSRLLSYTQAEMPVLSVTDENTDIGIVIEENGFGWKCLSDSPESFCDKVQQLVALEDLSAYGSRGRAYHQSHWLPEHACAAILKAVNKR